jgi:fatty-acyl-CoA synthase
MPLAGLMQDWPLTVDRIIDHAAAWHPRVEIVSRSVEGPTVRTTYAEVRTRAKKLSNALKALGVRPGDRVATMAWNTARHMEAWYGVMGMGAVCHTLNPRLFVDQLCYIINHAQDRVILADLTFLPLLVERRPGVPSVRHVVALTDREHLDKLNLPDVLCYEELIAQNSDDCDWGGFDENAAAALCYTSGTTGHPRGVLYSHRSNFLHTLVTMQADFLAPSAHEVVMPIVPMFHANAWGLAFSAPAAGSKLVMPGPRLDGPSVCELLEGEQVTFSAGVPTVWQMVLAHLRETGGRLSTLKRVISGGSAVPEALARAFREDYGVEFVHAWGMTELSPFGTLSAPTQEVLAMDADEQFRFAMKQGRPPLGIDLKLTDDADARLPHDGRTPGRLKVKGPFVAAHYFREEDVRIVDAEGFFDTGDIATIDPYGYMQITDRAKDVIKSGGEWISSVEIENLAVGHPKAALAAVIGVTHPKWGERPVLLVKLKPGESAAPADFLAYLEGRIARWWMPEEVVFVDEIPLGATGKIDKKLIRERMAGYALPSAAAAEP